MKKQYNFKKATIAIFLFFAGFMIVFGTFMYQTTAAAMKSQVGNQCLGIATATAAFIELDIDAYNDFIQTLDTQSEYYQNIKKRLEEIRYAEHTNIRFLYTEVKVSDQEMMYVLDGEREGDVLFSPPGDRDDLTVTRKRAYETENVYIGEEFTINDYGKLLSAYAPIHDKEGNFVGLVGVDISAAQYDEIMRYQLLTIIGSTVVLTMLMAALSYLLGKAYNAKLRSDQENISKTNFLARMSHEIRTPMNAIAGMSELMLRENLTPAAREQALSVKQASANLLAIINDILDFSKVESGKMEIVEAPYQFSSLVNDVISIIRMRLMDKPVFLTAYIESNLPNNMIGDEVRVRQLLLNVLSNAVKYTNEGHVSISITGKKQEDNRIQLVMEIQDTGIGIRAEDIDKLFGDFAQVDRKRNNNVEGTGLGLAITQNLCRSMGGDITVSSVYGEGSIFTATIWQRYEEYVPFAVVNEARLKNILLYEGRGAYAESIAHTLTDLEVPHTLVTTHSAFLQELRDRNYTHVFVSSFLYDSVKRMVDRLDYNGVMVVLGEYGDNVGNTNVNFVAMPAHAISVANVLNGIDNNVSYHESDAESVRFIAPEARVLVVDDITTNLRVAEGLLAPFQMVVDCAHNGYEAIDMVQLNRYDIVFMDHMMPGIDGIETVERIRALGENDIFYARLPIVALTANAVNGIREMFIQNGMNDFIAKPIETAKFYGILEKWIPKSKQEKCVEIHVASEHQEIKIKGIDTDAGIAMTGGNVDNYVRILEVFWRDSIEKATQIKDSFVDADFKLFTTCVHALKSASGSVGAHELSDFAKRLELAGAKGDVDYISDNIEKFLVSLGALSLEIQHYLEQVSVENKSDVKDDVKLLKEYLKRLKEALTVFEVETADEAITKLQECNFGEEVEGKLEQIYRAILLFEYEEADGVIDELLKL
ncbi:response regulator [Lachnospiraceae bacterium OttesenSCG-928-D06]|nr:response regulator [Lachnospiraceae bacterium OttesenSCG-928-D06]